MYYYLQTPRASGEHSGSKGRVKEDPGMIYFSSNEQQTTLQESETMLNKGQINISVF